MIGVSQATTHAVVSAPQYESRNEPAHGRDPCAPDGAVACHNHALRARAGYSSFSETPAYSVPAKGVVEAIVRNFSGFHNLLTIFKHRCDNSGAWHALFIHVGKCRRTLRKRVMGKFCASGINFGTFCARSLKYN